MRKLVYDVGASNLKFAWMSDEGEILEKKKRLRNWRRAAWKGPTESESRPTAA